MKDIELQPHQPPPPPRPGDWDQFTRQAAIVILLLGVLFLISALRPLLNLLGVTGIFILILSYPVNKLRTKTKLAYPVVVILVFVPLAILLFLLFGSFARWFVENIQVVLGKFQELIQSNSQAIETVNVTFGGGANIPSWLDDVFRYAGDQLSTMVKFISLTSILVDLNSGHFNTARTPLSKYLP